jgi:hypothetical protein
LPTNILTNPGFIEYLRVQNWEWVITHTI